MSASSTSTCSAPASTCAAAAPGTAAPPLTVRPSVSRAAWTRATAPSTASRSSAARWTSTGTAPTCACGGLRQRPSAAPASSRWTCRRTAAATYGSLAPSPASTRRTSSLMCFAPASPAWPRLPPVRSTCRGRRVARASSAAARFSTSLRAPAATAVRRSPGVLTGARRRACRRSRRSTCARRQRRCAPPAASKPTIAPRWTWTSPLPIWPPPTISARAYGARSATRRRRPWAFRAAAPSQAACAAPFPTRSSTAASPRRRWRISAFRGAPPSGTASWTARNCARGRCWRAAARRRCASPAACRRATRARPMRWI